MKKTSEIVKSYKEQNTALEKVANPKVNHNPVFYGKPIPLSEALEETNTLVDYYEALKNGRTLPQKPHRSLDFLLRCNAITSLHYTQTNLQLRGIGFKNWALAPDQVIFTWLFAHRGDTKRPLITLGNKSIRITERIEVQ